MTLDNPENSIIVASRRDLPTFAVSPVALQARDEALTKAALIGKVENAAQNKTAVDAQMELKRIATSFEKQRKILKEPILEVGRQLDRIVAKETADVEKEIGRLSQLTSEFQLAEQRRIREEQEVQRRELERIEREKQAELARIAAEQLAKERAAKEAAEAAARATMEATSKKQREAAMKASLEAERLDREAQAAQAAAAAESQRISEAAAASTMAEAKPITATRVAGQVVKTDWKIEVINPWELAKFHPDCVKIEPLLTPIKQALNAGITVKGIRAEKITTATVRPSGQFAIDV